MYTGSRDNIDSKVMYGEGDTETPSSSKDGSAAGLAIPRVVKFGYYREFVVTGDKSMATCHKCKTSLFRTVPELPVPSQSTS